MHADGPSLTQDPATRLAAQELERSGFHAYKSPGIAIPLRLLTGFFALWSASALAWPGSVSPEVAPMTAAIVLMVAVVGFGAAGIAGREWAKRRLQRCASWITRSVNQSSGIWYETPRARSTWWSVTFILLLCATAAPVGQVVTGFVAVIMGAIAAGSWTRHRRFGASRLVPDKEELLGGQTLSATLEATERLRRASHVRFDLKETSPGSWMYRPFVRATAIVPATAFHLDHGFTVVSVSLPVPPDAHPSTAGDEPALHYATVGGALEYCATLHGWEVHASAEVDGERYRAMFPFKLVSSLPSPVGPDYVPRPVVMPPADKTL